MEFQSQREQPRKLKYSHIPLVQRSAFLPISGILPERHKYLQKPYFRLLVSIKLLYIQYKFDTFQLQVCHQLKIITPCMH